MRIVTWLLNIDTRKWEQLAITHYFKLLAPLSIELRNREKIFQELYLRCLFTKPQ